jgi:hypothetical protein
MVVSSGGIAQMKYVFVYGMLAGLVVITVMCTGFFLAPGHDNIMHTLWFGYLVMLVALTFIFVGMKRYRDIERGGVIKFFPAFGLGVAIAFVAGLCYAAGWEAYLAATHYSFMDEYIAGIRHAREAAGVTGPALAREMADLETLRVQYQNPLFRIPMTFIEIFPVGLLVAIVAAALLRNPKFLRSAG